MTLCKQYTVTTVYEKQKQKTENDLFLKSGLLCNTVISVYFTNYKDA